MTIRLARTVKWEGENHFSRSFFCTEYGAGIIEKEQTHCPGVRLCMLEFSKENFGSFDGVKSKRSRKSNHLSKKTNILSQEDGI